MHRGGHPDAGPWFRLLDRDRRLLALLAEHKVLTTDQIATIEFASVRRAQDRLRKLREMGMLFAFRESLYGGGTSQTRHALGYLGARLIAAQRAQKPPAPSAHALDLERLACSPMLNHRLGVNDFFCALAAHRNPTRHALSNPAQGLTQWWSERQCAEVFWTNYSGDDKLTPDGYGCWEQDGRTVRFFLEYDTGTESLSIVTAKLTNYHGFPTDRFGILLFSLHSARRETGLRTALRREVSSFAPSLVIATTSRDLTHPDGPAGSVWALWTPHIGDADTGRLRLADLPERGPRILHHASTPQPYAEAAFDHFDPTIQDLLYLNKTRSTTPSSIGHSNDETGPAHFDDTMIEIPPPDDDWA
ncbi:replication-relaxation family protein [Nocardia sp. CDC160]|uniref:replication-relaxation family protein n=1 Tax=Nocardia sp. CDC160 TaxID=3112166 RepID=UPI002DBEC254|nr:replication-relaxation family protein [Nocardia sp. CDC160]MEC3916235.1 replication-relaxation family protein [Nocardia sp. CDC160]